MRIAPLEWNYRNSLVHSGVRERNRRRHRTVRLIFLGSFIHFRKRIESKPRNFETRKEGGIYWKRWALSTNAERLLRVRVPRDTAEGNTGYRNRWGFSLGSARAGKWSWDRCGTKHIASHAFQVNTIIVVLVFMFFIAYLFTHIDNVLFAESTIIVTVITKR